MAEAKRDRDKVGLAWLAWWALKGDEDPEFISEFLDLAIRRLGDRVLLGRDELLSDLRMFLIGLKIALDPSSRHGMALTLAKRKTGGHPGKSYREKLHLNRAVGFALEHMRRGKSKKEAVGEAMKEMTAIDRHHGLTDSKITRHLLKTEKQMISRLRISLSEDSAKK